MRRWLRQGCALTVLATSVADAQAVMSGVVRDSAGRALSGVEVLLEGSRWRALTDSSGRYAISASAGTYPALFRLLGYKPVRQQAKLTAGEVLTINAVLAPGNVQELETVDVKGPRPRGVGREAFEERRALGFGKFLDSAQLRKMEARRLSEVFRELGVRMVATRGTRQAQYAANPVKMNRDGTPSCYMTVILDGVTIYRHRYGSPESPPDFSRDFNILSLESIEVYRGGAQVPLEFAGRGVDCGVIVLWTRRGK